MEFKKSRHDGICPYIPTLRGLRQEDLEFEVSVAYTYISNKTRPVRRTEEDRNGGPVGLWGEAGGAGCTEVKGSRHSGPGLG